MRRLRIAIIGLVFLAGCAEGGKKTSNDLKQIGIAYHNYCDSNNKGPASEKDLAPYYENSPQLSEALRSGQYVFLWNISIADLVSSGQGMGIILAYEKDAPTKGGYVLLADASVKQMSPQEFASTPKAKPKEQSKTKDKSAP